MNTINVTNARKNLYKIIKSINDSHEPIHVSGKNGSVVIIAEEDWKAIEETLFLTTDPKLRKSIIDGMDEPIEKCLEKLDW